MFNLLYKPTVFTIIIVVNRILNHKQSWLLSHCCFVAFVNWQIHWYCRVLFTAVLFKWKPQYLWASTEFQAQLKTTSVYSITILRQFSKLYQSYKQPYLQIKEPKPTPKHHLNKRMEPLKHTMKINKIN